jgi:hypothetical protein
MQSALGGLCSGVCRVQSALFHVYVSWPATTTTTPRASSKAAVSAPGGLGYGVCRVQSTPLHVQVSWPTTITTS